MAANVRFEPNPSHSRLFPIRYNHVDMSTLPKNRNLVAQFFALPLAVRVIAGVAVGVILGTVFGESPYAKGISFTNADLGQLAVLVIRMLKALAAPLILFAILDSFVKTRISGRRGAKLLAICLVNVSVAMAIGLAIMNTLQPGLKWEGNLGQLATQAHVGDARVPTANTTKKPTLAPLANLAGYVPVSLIEPLLSNNVIAIVLLGIFGGAALRRVHDRQSAAGETSVHTVERFVDAVYQILMQMLTWLVQLVPFAVLAAVADQVGKFGLNVFAVLGVFLGTMLLGLAIHSLLYYPLVAWLVGGKSPRVYLGHGADAIVTGLSTNSSLATVPVTLRCLTERMGVSHQSARLAACVGTNFNNDGITLYEAMAALFIAQALGYHLELSQQMGVVLASIMAGMGIAGIPEAGLIVLPLVLSAAGLSEATIAVAIPLILPVDWIIARCRSGVNVMSDMLVAILLDRGYQEAEVGVVVQTES